MGEALLEQGELEQASEHFEDAIARKRDERLFYYALATAQIRLGDYEQAVRNLEQAREYSSSRDLWRYEHGMQDTTTCLTAGTHSLLGEEVDTSKEITQMFPPRPRIELETPQL